MEKLSVEDVYYGTKADLDRKGSACRTNARAFCSDGLKVSESTGNGTGVPVWYDSASATWIDYRTGVEVLV